MDIWLFACLLTVFGSLLAFAVAYHIHVMQKKNASAVQEVDHQIFKPDVTGPNSDLRKRISPRLKKPIQIQANIFKTQKSCWKQTTEMSLDRYFRIAFPVTFTIFAILYWTFYLLCT
ncbi:hypothetical protein JTE90_008725 [Oedothorax gibbosus]|uniref:Uncharacterized protein n=1 Tax=Oedothorax gibbosus TaxID=931172 RepID=A0AAV6UP16_9ARAC|nr:hypothetical protein JTE90_008725 [Oedothorax gibbosus]